MTTSFPATMNNEMPDFPTAVFIMKMHRAKIARFSSVHELKIVVEALAMRGLKWLNTRTWVGNPATWFIFLFSQCVKLRSGKVIFLTDFAEYGYKFTAAGNDITIVDAIQLLTDVVGTLKGLRKSAISDNEVVFNEIFSVLKTIFLPPDSLAAEIRLVALPVRVLKSEIYRIEQIASTIVRCEFLRLIDFS